MCENCKQLERENVVQAHRLEYISGLLSRAKVTLNECVPTDLVQEKRIRQLIALIDRSMA